MGSVKTHVVLALALALAGCEKYALDRQMEELCKKDGGIQVFEKATLPSALFDPSGRLMMERLGYAVSDGWTFDRIANDEYRLLTKKIVLNDGAPMRGQGRLVKVVQEVRRTRDRAVLGRSIWYVRTGGDLVVIDHFSMASCPVPSPQLILAVFQGEK